MAKRSEFLEELEWEIDRKAREEMKGHTYVHYDSALEAKKQWMFQRLAKKLVEWLENG